MILKTKKNYLESFTLQSVTAYLIGIIQGSVQRKKLVFLQALHLIRY